MTVKHGDEEQCWKIDDPLYNQIYQKAEPFLNVRHNKVHTRMCYQLALRLLEDEEGDPAIVIPAILLHDTGYSQVPEDQLLSAFVPGRVKPEVRRMHEVESARLAGEILHSVNYPEEYIGPIQAIIDGHDTREAALNQNDKIVQDADKLFRFTREGFLLASSFYKVEPQQFLNNLNLRTQSWFFTETARRLAVEEMEQRKEDFLEIFHGGKRNEV